MTATIEIGSLISSKSDLRGGRPVIAGTGVTVKRIVGWYQLGLSPDEIVMEIPHLNIAQVFAALTYYHVNREQIEADLAAERAEADKLEQTQRNAGSPS